MADETGGKPRPTPPARQTTGASRTALSPDEVRVLTARAPRCRVAIAVLCAPATANPDGTPADTAAELAAELVNVSRSGMLVTGVRPFEVGTSVEFQFRMDEVVALRGTAVVARVEADVHPARVGLRFVALDAEAEDLLARLIDAGAAPPEIPTAPGYAAPAVEFEHGSIRVRLSAATALYFTYNPLLHIGVAGCFLPADRDVPLGTGYQLDIFDEGDHLLLRCKATVAAKQEGRIGLRFVDVPREALHELRARVVAASGGADIAGRFAHKLAPGS
jgi:hypothetical protein